MGAPTPCPVRGFITVTAGAYQVPRNRTRQNSSATLPKRASPATSLPIQPTSPDPFQHPALAFSVLAPAERLASQRPRVSYMLENGWMVDPREYPSPRPVCKPVTYQRHGEMKIFQQRASLAWGSVACGMPCRVACQGTSSTQWRAPASRPYTSTVSPCLRVILREADRRSSLESVLLGVFLTLCAISKAMADKRSDASYLVRAFFFQVSPSKPRPNDLMLHLLFRG